MAFTIEQIASYNAEYEPFGWEAGHRFLRYGGNLYAVGVDNRTTSKIVMFTSTDNGDNWTSEEVVDLTGLTPTRAVTNHPNMVIDGLGVFHIVFRSSNLVSGWDEICYISGYAGNWSALTVLAAPEVANVTGPDITIDIDGFIHVLWMEHADPNYNVIRKIIGGAQETVYTTDNAGWSPRIVAGTATGELHAMWLSDPDGDYSMIFVYGYYNGSTWAFDEFDPNATGMTPEPFASEGRVLVDAGGTVHLFLVYSSNPDYYPSVFHYYDAGAGWVGPTLIRQETVSPLFILGSPTVDAGDVVYVPISRCDTVGGDLDPPGSMIIYKYEGSTWSVAETFLCDTGYIVKAASLIAPSNSNDGFIGVFDYGFVTDAYQWTAEYDPSAILAEVIVATYHLEFYYNGQSQGSIESAAIFLPLVTDEEIYKLVGIKNISGTLVQGINVSAVSTHGTVSFALGSSGEIQTDGKMKTYSENVFTPSVANGGTTYIWMKWKNTTPRYVGANTIQLTNVVY